jgi:uncharacterized protein
MTFAATMGTPAPGTMTAVVALMEFAVIISLLIARWSMQRQSGGINIGELLVSTLRGRGIVLLSGGMLIGGMATQSQWEQIEPFYQDMFRGFLMLFLLEMGITAARQIKGFASVGMFMTGFGIAAPLIFGLVGVSLGHMIGLELGGAFVLGAVCASASFIDAPAAPHCRRPTQASI